MSTSVAAPRVGTFRPANPRWIDDWRPEDPVFWQNGGRTIARRNLIFSILSEHIGFSIWSLWSVFVLFLGPAYGFDPSQKFLLTAMPALVGSIVRLPYSYAVAKFGGRNWTIFSSLLLLVPCVLTGIVLEPGVSFTTLLLVAMTAGLGGGNFASSMVNIAAYYPHRLKGWALGLNAGGGNIGVAAVQLMGLLVLATAGAANPRLILLIYVPAIAIAGVCASIFMNNLTHMKNDTKALREVTTEGHAWVLSFLYIGTFGSFIGFSFAFGQVLLVQFPETFTKPIEAAYVTFLGPLIGSLIRPVGGRLADAFGGARVTFLNFVGMAAAAGVVLAASIAGNLPLFITGFITLFVFAGIGNGSTYKMIPTIFESKGRIAVAAGADEEDVKHRARRLSGALIGVAGAIGALGGVAVNVAFRESFLANGNGNAAYVAFIAFYVACIAVTWVVYLRRRDGRLAGV